jgi:hypothetical protein
MTGLAEAGLSGMERLLGRHALVTTLLPIVLAAAASGAVVLAATDRTPGDVLAGWQRYSGSAQALAVVGTLLAVAALAYLLTTFQLPLIRILEGYWPDRAPLRGIARRRTDRHRRRVGDGWNRVRAAHQAGEHVRAAATAAGLTTAYPPPGRLDACLPTALGNRLRAAELYPLERYGIDSVVIWPRLYPLLPDAAAGGLATARATLDATVMITVLSALFGTAWPIGLAVQGGHLRLAGLVLLLGWVVAWAAHRAALQAASAFGDQVKVAVDLHRRELLRHLEIGVPGDLSAERRVWDDLTQFYLRNLPPESL